MAAEIERKFLVTGMEWKQLAGGVLCRQGYLSSAKERTVRVRIIGDKGFLTIKGVTVDISRQEFEYEIPLQDATQMLDTLAEQPLIEKYRYRIVQDDLVWEVDEFLGDNAGLVVAEIELAHAQQAFARPEWIGDEVSTDPRYFNSNLVKYPFKQW